MDSSSKQPTPEELVARLKAAQENIGKKKKKIQLPRSQPTRQIMEALDRLKQAYTDVQQFPFYPEPSQIGGFRKRISQTCTPDNDGVDGITS